MASPDWLKPVIANGLQALLVLRLEGAPAAADIKKTAHIWWLCLGKWHVGWDERLDKPRLEEAFIIMAGQSAKWPNPSILKQHLPPRQYPQIQISHDYPEEKARANREKIKDLIAKALAK